jgi:hypothetical protein
MLLRELFENRQSVGLIFGRFNPPHKGHRAAWEMASENDAWYVGTNRSTQGPKDPLPYDVKIKAMEAIWPEVAKHIVPHQSWLTLASEIYKKHGDVELKVYTDEEWVLKALAQYNGAENQRHGYYNFPKITPVATPRLSSATALRAAVAADDREAFEKAAGVPADTPVDGTPFFDLVAKYLGQYKKESASNGASPEEEDKFHRELDKLVHKTFGHSSDEKKKKSVDVKKKFNEEQEITPALLKKLEFYVDKLFATLGMDVEFTRHFLDRVNDPRNIKPITIQELALLFKKTYSKWGKKIAQLGPDAQAVIKDMSTDINMPFVLNWDPRNRELDLVAKTVMRKKNFTTPNQEFPVENFADGKNPGRKGLAKRSGVNTKASVSSLRKTAKNSSGEKQRMAHWLANMKSGRAKKK